MANLKFLWRNGVVGNALDAHAGALAMGTLTFVPARSKGVASDEPATEISLLECIRPTLHEFLAGAFFQYSVVVADDLALGAEFVPEHLADTLAAMVELYPCSG